MNSDLPPLHAAFLDRILDRVAAEGQPGTVRRAFRGRDRVRRQKHHFGLMVRTIGLTRAATKIGLANLAYNIQRFIWIEGRTAPA
jgi:hypothetical protein